MFVLQNTKLLQLCCALDSNHRNWQLLEITKLITYCIQMSKFTKQIDAGKLDSKFQEIGGSDHGV